MIYRSIWMGYDAREALAFAMARYSIERFNRDIPIHGLVLEDLIQQGHYSRPITRTTEGSLWDPISQAPMSTEFANSRFLVPRLTDGWALFVDSDVFFRRNPKFLFDLADPSKAVMVVKHDYPQKAGTKMDGQIQTVYSRKNWSSVMLFNCDHPANVNLTTEMINSLPGRDLHRFCWLSDDLIGDLPPEWNYCVGHSDLKGVSPAVVHYTDGIPDMPGYEDSPYADEWRALRPYAVGALFGRPW